MKQHYIFIFFYAALSCFALPAWAAQVDLSAASTSVQPGSSTTVDILLNTQGQVINSVSGTLTLNGDAAQLTAVSFQDSVVDFWPDDPSAKSICQSNCSMSFSGIITNGFAGNIEPYDQTRHPGKLLSLTFRGVHNGSVQIVVTDIQLLHSAGVNDNNSTHNSSFTLQVDSTSRAHATPTLIDTIPPSIFTPEVVHTPFLNNGAWSVVFATQDNQSGIDHYEILDSSTGIWKSAISPYALSGEPSDVIAIKAIDKAGNQRIGFASPPASGWYAQPVVLFMIGMVLLGLFAVGIGEVARRLR